MKYADCTKFEKELFTSYFDDCSLCSKGVAHKLCIHAKTGKTEKIKIVDLVGQIESLPKDRRIWIYYKPFNQDVCVKTTWLIEWKNNKWVLIKNDWGTSLY